MTTVADLEEYRARRIAEALGQLRTCSVCALDDGSVVLDVPRHVSTEEARQIARMILTVCGPGEAP